MQYLSIHQHTTAERKCYEKTAFIMRCQCQQGWITYLQQHCKARTQVEKAKNNNTRPRFIQVPFFNITNRFLTMTFFHLTSIFQLYQLAFQVSQILQVNFDLATTWTLKYLLTQAYFFSIRTKRQGLTKFNKIFHYIAQC